MKHGIVRTAAITGSASQVVAPGKKRVALVFSPPLTGSYTVHTEADVASGAGMNVLPGTGALCLDKDTHGDVLNKGWYAIGSGAMTIAFIETYEE